MFDGIHSLLYLPELSFLIPECSVSLLIYQGSFSLKGEAVYDFGHFRENSAVLVSCICRYIKYIKQALLKFTPHLLYL
jgi:hypothetical protein